MAKKHKPHLKVTEEIKRQIRELDGKGVKSVEISRQTGLSQSAVSAIRKRLGLARRLTLVTPELKARVKELWAEGFGMTVEQLCGAVKINRDSVRKILREMNLPTRVAARLKARETAVSNLAPLPKKNKKTIQRLGQNSDDTFSWIAKVCIAEGGAPDTMEEWRRFAAEYMQFCHGPKGPGGFANRLRAISTFLRYYLWARRITEPKRFFTLPSDAKLPALLGPEGTAPFRPKTHGVDSACYACDWLDWILETHFSSDEEGPKPHPFPGHWVPLDRPTYDGVSARADTTDKDALPFTYVKKLRAMLAAGPNFEDWKWAQDATGLMSGPSSGDWFTVDKRFIDENDPDCVVRPRTRDIRNGENHPQHPFDPTKHNNTIVGKETFFQMWSPVVAVAMLMKLEMPFRTYQVRMLDSGESDPLRVEIDPEEETRFLAEGGKTADARQVGGHSLFRWQSNENERSELLAGLTHNDALRVKGARGVFAKFRDPDIGDYVGFYINTNKTADIGTPAQLRGYHIRWQHHSLHRWLIKLRNWQKKYNPIASPTLWAELEMKHFGAKKSAVDVATAVPTCFLFRDASARGKSTTGDERKPILAARMAELWAKMLDALERSEARPGARPPGAIPLLFIKTREPNGTPCALHYPLHALRVSLITGLAEGMKLETLMHIAGHTRLVMTIYYIKQNTYLINEEMRAAAKKQAKDEEKQTQAWLLNLSYESLPRHVVANQEGLRAALPRNPLDRSAVQLERHLGGWCLMGGNVAPISESRYIGGCFNGGKMIGEKKSKTQNQRWEAVRPKACIECRCRWFVTSPGFILEIKARMDLLVTNLSLAQERRDEAEITVRDLEAEFHRAEVAAEAEKEKLQREGRHADAAKVVIAWTKGDDLDAARRWEDRAVQEVDEIRIGVDNASSLIDDIFALVAKESQTNAPTPLLLAQGSPTDVAQALGHVDGASLNAAKIPLETEVHFASVTKSESPPSRPWSFEPVSELEQLSVVCFNAVEHPELESQSYGPIVRRTQALEAALESKGFNAKFARLDPHVQLRLANKLTEELAGSLGGNLATMIKHLEGPGPLPPPMARAMQYAIASGAYEPIRLESLLAKEDRVPKKKAIK